MSACFIYQRTWEYLLEAFRHLNALSSVVTSNQNSRCHYLFMPHSLPARSSGTCMMYDAIRWSLPPQVSPSISERLGSVAVQERNHPQPHEI